MQSLSGGFGLRGGHLLELFLLHGEVFQRLLCPRTVSQNGLACFILSLSVVKTFLKLKHSPSCDEYLICFSELEAALLKELDHQLHAHLVTESLDRLTFCHRCVITPGYLSCLFQLASSILFFIHFSFFPFTSLFTSL